MDKQGLQRQGTEKSVLQDPALIAEWVHRDFGELVAIFARHVETAQCGINHSDRSAVLEARAAAEQGLRLSRQLVDLLRVTGTQT
jgi:hypothetical protein